MIVRLFKSFISGNLVGTDYMNGPNGALDWVGSRIRHNFPRVHPKDLYTIRDKVRHLGAFLNKLFVGIGFLEAVPAGEGFTMKTWFEFYIEQLDLTSYYTLYERKCNHLYQCSRQMGAFLRLAEIAVEREPKNEVAPRRGGIWGAHSRGLPAGKDPPRPSRNRYLAERGGAA